jgi:MFS superfamily sulfate permease-like transporter
MPDFSPAVLQQLLPIAAAVALLALTEAASIARSMALKSGQRLDGNHRIGLQIRRGRRPLAGSHNGFN